MYTLPRVRGDLTDSATSGTTQANTVQKNDVILLGMAK